MAGETVITVVGNLVDDPELRFTPTGAAVAKFRVASVPRTFNKDTQQWENAKDGLFLTCSVWRQAAENAAETLQRGMRVIVQGRLKQRSYEDREGVKRTVYELDVEEVGPSLKSATAVVTKTSSSGSGGQGQGQGQGREAFQRARQEQGAVSAEDPWASNTPGTSGAPAGGGWGSGSQGGGYSDEPPF
ncbi:single-stranded DNA-binding protein [Streptomyces rubiginosohelvolus]|uniref:single-stranded DNA-binding protein n=1 Tax=Streptomyces rubiginosohelvolus TaxID=67362 RepID=UPI0036D8BDA6